MTNDGSFGGALDVGGSCSVKGCHDNHHYTLSVDEHNVNEAFGKHLVSTFIVPKLRESVKEILDNALQGKETSNYELEIKTKTNEFRYLLVNATTRRNAENKIIGGKYDNITLRWNILRIIITESSLLPDIQ